MSRPHVYSISIDLSTFRTQMAQLSLGYLHASGHPVSDRVKVAVACLYSPLGAAIDGESLQAIRLRVKASQGSFETYMVLATSYSQENIARVMPKQQLAPSQKQIKTTSVEHKPAGLGAKYLNSGVIEPCAGVELALACLYGPLGVAMAGQISNEIEAAISASRQVFQTYMDLALRQFADETHSVVRFSDSETKTTAEMNPQIDRSVTALRKPVLHSVQSMNDLKEGMDDDIDLNEEL